MNLLTTKLLFTYISTILLLQLKIVYGSSKFQIDKGCVVNEKQHFNMLEDNSFNVSFFISPEDPISIQVYFKNHKRYEDNDLLILMPNSGKIQRKRNRKATTSDVTLNTDILLGWNFMTVSLQENRLDIENVYTLTGFEFDISDITFTAKYVTKCIKKTLIWEIKGSHSASIPLNGLTRFGIKLDSDQPFRPDLSLHTLDIPLSYDGKVVARELSVPLPPQDYQLAVEQSSIMVSIFTISKNEDYKLLMKAAIKEDFMNLKVGSQEGKFRIMVDPYLGNYYEEDIEKTKKVKASYCTVWQITTGFALAIAVISWIICIYLMRIASISQQSKGKEIGLLDSVRVDERRPSEEVPLLESNQDEMMYKAVNAGDIIAMQAAISRDTAVNYQGLLGRTPLHLACEQGHLAFVQELVKAGANIETLDNIGRTAFYVACYEGHHLIVEELLRVGAIKDTPSYSGMTPLHMACVGGYFLTVQKLLGSNVNMEIPNKIGGTPLYTASYGGYHLIVHELVGAGANMETPNNAGRTPLYAACDQGHLPIIQELLGAGANKNTTDKAGWTLLHAACARGHLPVVLDLLEVIENINMPDNEDYTPLSIARLRDQTDVVKVLLKAGAK